MKPSQPLACCLFVSVLLSACGGGTQTPTSGAASADTVGHRRTMAVPTTLSVAIPAEADPLFQALAIPADAATRGMWSTVQAWPMNAVHLALLPDGRVLSHGTAPGAPNQPDGRIFDFWSPGAGFTASAHLRATGPGLPDTFGSASAERGDGNLLIIGGNAARTTTLVQWRTSTVADLGTPLADDRWYSTAITLADGRVASVGGMTPNGEASLLADAPITTGLSGVATEIPQVYSPGSGWTDAPIDPYQFIFTQDLGSSTPKAWLGPGGDLVGVAPRGDWALGIGTGHASVAHGLNGMPADAFGPMAVGAMFAPGRILIAGGGGLSAADAATGLQSAYVIDINGGTPIFTATSPLPRGRRLANATVLPNGQVLLTGGTDSQNLGGSHAIRTADRWDPVTGTWQPGAAAATDRLLHATALLLPNGAVLTAGGGAPGPVANENAEIYYPPYLFRDVNGTAALAPRPDITGLNALDFGHGQALRIELGSGQRASRLVLVRTGTVSQSVNNGQRLVELPFTQTGDRIDATTPANAHLAPPGHYLLQVLDAAGVPSRAVVVGIGLEGSTSVPRPILTPGGIYALRNVAAPLKVLGFDGTPGAPTTITSLDVSPAATTPDQAQFIVVHPTLPRAGCFSLALKGYSTGFDVLLLAYTTPTLFQPEKLSIVSPYPLTNQDLSFKQNTTFCPEQAPGGRGIVLRPQSAPGRVLNMDATGPRVDAEQPTMAFALGSAFEPTLLGVPAGSTGNVAPGVGLIAPGSASTAPAAGATVPLQARAEDYDGSIVRVEFYDGTTLISTTTDNSGFRGSFVSTWTATTGTHVITARAIDNAGASSTSAPYTLVIGPVVTPPPPPMNKAPTVTLSAPAYGAAVPSGTTVTLMAVAADADGSIASVAFYDGVTLLGIDTTAPYNLLWKGATGTHLLRAQATDNLGATASSATVSVQVKPPVPVTPACQDRERSRKLGDDIGRNSRCPGSATGKRD